MVRRNISSGTNWEVNFGYSRAVIINSAIHIAGTTAIDYNGNIIGKNNAYEQTKYILSKIKAILEDNEFEMGDIIRTRIFITDIHYSDQVGKAHYEYFNEIRPVSTMVEVNKLIGPELLVEIEVDGIKS